MSRNLPHHRTAIVIGNNDAGAADALQHAETDARDMAQELKNCAGFEVHLLLGSEATADRAREVVREHARDGGLLVVYLGGHGGCDQRANDQYFWTFGYRDGKPNSFLALRRDIIDVVRKVSAATTRLVIIYDCCRSDVLISSDGRSNGRKRNTVGANRDELEKLSINDASPVAILYGTGEGDTAQEDDTAEGSYLARGLITELRNATDDLEVEEWLRRAEVTMVERHQDENLSGPKPSFHIMRHGKAGSSKFMIRDWQVIATDLKRQLEVVKMPLTDAQAKAVELSREVERAQAEARDLRRANAVLREKTEQLELELAAGVSRFRVWSLHPGAKPLAWTEVTLDGRKARCAQVLEEHLGAFVEWCKSGPGTDEPLPLLPPALRQEIAARAGSKPVLVSWREWMIFANWVAVQVLGAPDRAVYNGKASPGRKLGVRYPLPAELDALKKQRPVTRLLAQHPWWLTTSQHRASAQASMGHRVNDPLSLGDESAARLAWSTTSDHQSHLHIQSTGQAIGLLILDVGGDVSTGANPT